MAIGGAAGLAALLAGARQLAAEGCPTVCPKGKVVFGVSTAVSGVFAASGQQVVKGVEIAVEALNVSGGLLGFQVEAIIRDDSCNPERARSNATDFVQRDEVAFVLGPSCSSAALAAAPIYNSAGVVQITPSASAIALTQRGHENLFRLGANDAREAQALTTFIAREQRNKKITVLYSDSPFGRTFIEQMQRASPADVMGAISFDPVTPTVPVPDPLVDKLRNQAPDVIYTILDPEQAGQFARRFRQQNGRSELVSGQRLLTSQYWNIAGEAGEGTLTLAPLSTAQEEEFKRVTEAAQKRSVTPDLFLLNSYAGVQIWADAVRRAKGGDPKIVIKELRSGTFTTAIGKVSFDAQGDRPQSEYALTVWKGGRLQQRGGL
jgi:branched-chain amino acid transport system substrate-binding protein